MLVITKYKALRYGHLKDLVQSDFAHHASISLTSPPIKEARYEWSWIEILRDLNEVIELYKAITVKIRLCLR